MRLLDLFCCAGGAAVGYHRAGFDEIVGVDIRPQKRYPFTFVLGDALEYVAAHGHEFDAIHASPPCEQYSKVRHLAGDYPKLIHDTRELLKKTGLHYVIENVPGAPLFDPHLVTAEMFGMGILRNRLFECSFYVPFHVISQRTRKAAKMGRPVKADELLLPVGHFSNVALARREMGIDWMTRDELAEAIPPAYTEYIGRFLLEEIKAKAAP